jgi:hypothetical protein
MLGLVQPPETIDGAKPDFQAHEVGKFCQLLIKGNPGIVEMLFTEHMQVETAHWSVLRANGEQFLTKHTVEQYLGYAKGQLTNMKRGGRLHTKGGSYNEKWAYHMIRILSDAERIVEGAEPLVWKDGSERDRLMAVRHGEWTAERVEEEAASVLDRIESKKPWNLPDEPPLGLLNEWLLAARG